MSALYQQPTIDAEKVKTITGLSTASCYKIINELVGLNILKKKTASTYVFERYIELFGNQI